MNEIDRIIRTALAEDIGWGDITTRACIMPGSQSRAELVAKEDFVLAGIDVAGQVFAAIDSANLQMAQLRMNGRFAQLQQGILDKAAAQHQSRHTRADGRQGQRGSQLVAKHVAQREPQHARHSTISMTAHRNEDSERPTAHVLIGFA